MQRHSCRLLRRDTLLFVVAHFPACRLAAGDHFARLPQGLLTEILSHDALTHGERVVFEAAVQWLEARRSAGKDG